MPRQKRASDDLYNARKRIRRAAKKAERKGETERARQLRLALNQTYVKGNTNRSVKDAANAALAILRRDESKGDREDRKERNERQREQYANLISGLRRASRGGSGPAGAARALTEAVLQRRNATFAKELNMASAGGESILSDKTYTIDGNEYHVSGKSQARIFWMSTRRLWMGSKPENRYKKIMDAFKTDSLEWAFDKVMSLNQEAITSAAVAEQQVRDTLPDMQDESQDVSELIGSPPEFLMLATDSVEYALTVNPNLNIKVDSFTYPDSGVAE